MYSDSLIDELRQETLDMVSEADLTPAVNMGAWTEDPHQFFPSAACDDDGDYIKAYAVADFTDNACGDVRASFAKGADPMLVARVLRKFADMLDGPQGSVIVALGLVDHDLNMAERLPDGKVAVFNDQDEEHRMRWRALEAFRSKHLKQEGKDGDEA